MQINIVGVINKTGFGTHAKNMIKAFDAINVKTTMSPLQNVLKADATKSVIKSLHSKKDINSPSLYLCHDGYLKDQNLKQLILFQVFETTIIRPDTIARIQSYATEVFTPTQKHKELLIANGVTKKIHVVHEGVDKETFNTDCDVPLIETNKYTYLLVGKNERRKNTTMVITSFINTMKDEPVALICHTYNHRFGKDEMLKNWCELDLTEHGYAAVEDDLLYIKFSNGTSDIYFTKPVLLESYMKDLYHSANVGISYSSGEGWGLPEMEMMACGKPVIISNVLGHEEYLKDMPVFRELIVEPIGDEVANDGVFFNGTTGTWSELSPILLNEKLKYVYDNNIGDVVSQELSDYYTTNYSWVEAAQTIRKILF